MLLKVRRLQLFTWNVWIFKSWPVVSSTKKGRFQLLECVSIEFNGTYWNYFYWPKQLFAFPQLLWWLLLTNQLQIKAVNKKLNKIAKGRKLYKLNIVKKFQIPYRSMGGTLYIYLQFTIKKSTIRRPSLRTLGTLHRRLWGPVGDFGLSRVGQLGPFFPF